MSEHRLVTERAHDTPAQATDQVRQPLPMRLLDSGVNWYAGSKHGVYSFAALRIIYGAIILLVLATCYPDRHYMWGVGSRFIDTAATGRGYPWFFEAIFVKSSVIAFDIAYLILAFLAFLFMIGWRTRWVAPLLLLFWIGLSVQTTLVTNGGDTVMRITLFFALFADLSSKWSVDEWLSKLRLRRGLRERRREGILPSWAGNIAHNTALILCAYQIALIYGASALLKLQGTEWLNGTATYYSLVLEVFQPFPWLNELVASWDVAVYLATYATLGLQLLFPLFVLWRPTRIVALIGVTGLHFGIGLFMGLWPFSLAMIALDFLYVRDRTWEEFNRLVGRARVEGLRRWRSWRGTGPRRTVATPVD